MLRKIFITACCSTMLGSLPLAANPAANQENTVAIPDPVISCDGADQINEILEAWKDGFQAANQVFVKYKNMKNQRGEPICTFFPKYEIKILSSVPVPDRQAQGHVVHIWVKKFVRKLLDGSWSDSNYMLWTEVVPLRKEREA